MKSNVEITKYKKRPNTDREIYINFLFDEILEWHQNTTVDFDIAFVDSLHEQFTRTKRLSDSQYEALKNIYQTWVCH